VGVDDHVWNDSASAGVFFRMTSKTTLRALRAAHRRSSQTWMRRMEPTLRG
jgi:hypothetical protein